MSDLLVEDSPGRGRGVFATELLDPGDDVLRFEGPILRRGDLKPNEEYIQVGPNLFIGASGRIDDYVNHSCDPNSGVVINGSAYLIALRTILPGEEITFDYSTTSTEDLTTWVMACTCCAPNCRGLISGFGTVPETVQAARIKAGVVPMYVIEHIAGRVFG